MSGITRAPASNDAIEAIEAKVGTGASTPTLGKVLTGTGTGTSGWALPALPYLAPAPSGGDDYAVLQALLTAAFNAPGGTLVLRDGEYLMSAALITPANTAGSVRIVGAGRPKSGVGAWSGDPTAAQGTTIRSTSTTADVFSATVTTTRQYIELDSLAIVGNVGSGSTGHGLHFSAASASGSIIVTLRDVSVMSAKDNGIFFDGNVFESQMYGVRATSCGAAGFRADDNSGGLPGETRIFGGVFDDNDIGIDLGGGGGFSLHGVTASSNTHEGIVATAVYLRVYELQLELNGTDSGNQATFTSLYGALLAGVSMTVKHLGTGNGLSFVGCIGCQVSAYVANSADAGVGYKDFRMDVTSNRNEVIMRTTAGSYEIDYGGGHVVRTGSSWETSQSHSQILMESSDDGNDSLAVWKYDSFISKRTVASKTRAFVNPDMNYGYHDGQRITIHVWNASAGVTTTTFNSMFLLAGAWVDPGAGNTRTITFEWDNNRTKWVELCRSAADIT